MHGIHYQLADSGTVPPDCLPRRDRNVPSTHVHIPATTRTCAYMYTYMYWLHDPDRAALQCCLCHATILSCIVQYLYRTLLIFMVGSTQYLANTLTRYSRHLYNTCLALEQYLYGHSVKMLPYSGKLSKEKTFVNFT